MRLEAAPSPFRQETTIAFSIAEDGPVDLTIYDFQGCHVQTLLDEEMTAGEYTVAWNGRAQDGRRMHTGVYFGRLCSAAEVRCVKMVLAE